MFGKTCFALALTWLALPALAAPQPVLTPPAPLENIHQSGFVYCVNDVLNTFNPQMARSGVTIDTLAAQLYDRLLDVDPYTYRLMPELAQRWEVLDNGSTYRFYLRHDVPFQNTSWFSPTRNMNADDVIFSFQRMLDKNTRIMMSTAVNIPISIACNSPIRCKVFANWANTVLKSA